MIRQEGLPELVTAWQAAARDLASRDGIQLGIADEGGTRTQSDTTRILGYREQDYAVYAAAEKKAGRNPQSMSVWRPINAFGTSFHNYGAARDGSLISRPRTMTYDQAVTKVRAAMVRAGLRGISSANDQLHFELPITLNEAQQRWFEFSNKTGRYAPPVEALPGGDIAGAGDDAGTDDSTDEADDGSGGSDTTSGPPAGGALLGVLVAIVVVGGGYILYRRLTL